MSAALDITKEQHKTLLKLLRKFIPGVAVWAYGSRVRWTARPNSDLDLVVFANLAQKPLVSELKDSLAESDLPFLVDIHVWDEVPQRFHSIIRKEYVVLQEAEEQKPHVDLPVQWKEKSLGELTDNFDGQRIPVKGSERKPGIFPYYGASGIVDHVDKFIFDGEYLLIAEDGENLRTQKTPIAFLARGKFWVNNHAHIVTGNAQSDTRFLMYALNNADIHGYLTGSTMPKLTQGNLNRIPILAPPPHEQRAIAAVLGALDDKIELNRQMNATLESLLQTIFKSLFLDATADKLPKGWRKSTIGQEVRVVGGSTPSTTKPEFWEGGTHHWATPKDLSTLNSPVLLDTERKITDTGVKQIGSGLLPVGTVLLSSRAPIGYLAISEIPVAINQGFIAMICDSLLTNHFVRLWTKQNMEAIEGRANGTTFMEISKSNFRTLPVLVPPLPLLNDFQKQAEPLHRRVISNLRETRLMSALRDALLPKLLSGELRVPAKLMGSEV